MLDAVDMGTVAEASEIARRRARAARFAANSGGRRAATLTAAEATLLRPVRDYAELRAAIDARRQMLGMTMADLDHVSGVESGYSAKLICGTKRFGEMSLQAILGALRVDLLLLERRS